VFEVRTRSRDRARDGGIERSAHSAEEQDGGDARTDLEGAVRDVLVRYPIAREVKEQPERQRSEPRTDERAAGRSRRDMKGDDQAATLACGTLDGPPRADGLSWSQISCLVVAQEPKGARTTALFEDYVYRSMPAGLGQTLAHPPSASRRVGGTVPNQREGRPARRRAAPAPARTTTPAAQHYPSARAPGNCRISSHQASSSGVIDAGLTAATRFNSKAGIHVALRLFCNNARRAFPDA